MPNIKELQSIVESCGDDPAINTTIFPETPAGYFWSASSYGPLPAGAWIVLFLDGSVDALVKASVGRVRLVRGGQSFDAFDLLLGSVTVSKTVTGTAAGSVPAGTNFPIALTCGATTLGPLNATTAAPAVFTNVPVGSCTVTEGTLPSIAGVTWGTPVFAPSATVTVTAGANTPVTVTNTANITTYAITKNVSPTGSGTVSCDTDPVPHGGGSTCTASANAGYAFANWSGDCTGATCALSNVTATRTVTSNFTLNSYPITTTANPAAGGTVNCTPNPVDHGGTATCTATASAGYTFGGWSGCTGTGASCALSNVTATQTVTANFTLNTYPITKNVNPAGSGTVSCDTDPVPHGGGSTCTATANAGYTFTSWSGDCTGTGTCTLSNVTATRSVTATFVAGADKTFTGPTATGTGDATATVSGGGDTCGFTPTPRFVPVSVVPAAPPAGYDFPHGLFDFTLANCTPGGTVTLTITYPSALPAGTVYWKYGPTPGNASPGWYQMQPATIAGNTATFSIADGGLGDDDLTVNGSIVDQGGPGAPGTADIPTLSEWAMLILLSLLLGSSGWRLRRRFG